MLIKSKPSGKKTQENQEWTLSETYWQEAHQLAIDRKDIVDQLAFVRHQKYLLKKPCVTFKELHDLGFKSIYFVGANISTSNAEIFSYETTPDAIVSDALRIFMSIPLVFKPHQLYIKQNGLRVAHPLDLGEADQQALIESGRKAVNDYFQKRTHQSSDQSPLDIAVEMNQKPLVLSLVAHGMYACQQPEKVQILLKDAATCEWLDTKQILSDLSHFEAFHQNQLQPSQSSLKFF